MYKGTSARDFCPAALLIRIAKYVYNDKMYLSAAVVSCDRGCCSCAGSTRTAPKKELNIKNLQEDQLKKS